MGEGFRARSKERDLGSRHAGVRAFESHPSHFGEGFPFTAIFYNGMIWIMGELPPEVIPHKEVYRRGEAHGSP